MAHSWFQYPWNRRRRLTFFSAEGVVFFWQWSISMEPSMAFGSLLCWRQKLLLTIISIPRTLFLLYLSTNVPRWKNSSDQRSTGSPFLNRQLTDIILVQPSLTHRGWCDEPSTLRSRHDNFV
jgi:hypothetical protein